MIEITLVNPIVHRQFEYYLSHQAELVEKYNGKVLVIANQAVVGVYDSEDDAYWDAIEKYQLGTFCIQLCTPGRKAYTMHNYSPYFRP